MPLHQSTLPPITTGSQLSAAAAVAAAAQAAHAAAQPSLNRGPQYMGQMGQIADDVAAFAAAHQNRFTPLMNPAESVVMMQQGSLPPIGGDGYVYLIFCCSDELQATIPAAEG